ncbi:MAG: MotA/TolQ/ExbB proton channel family protein, partial [Candidatus Eiseniibacteriota bacterium]
IHAILFWGVLAALLGFLGQTTGLYKALTVIAGAREISPVMVAQGFAESLTTTLFGMVLLVLSAVAWFGLHAAYRRVAGRAALHAVSG